MMEVMRLSYEKSINLLKAKGIEFETGLTGVEMEKIESTYKIEFPKSLKMFLMQSCRYHGDFITGEILMKIISGL